MMMNRTGTMEITWPLHPRGNRSVRPWEKHCMYSIIHPSQIYMSYIPIQNWYYVHLKWNNNHKNNHNITKQTSMFMHPLNTPETNKRTQNRALSCCRQNQYHHQSLWRRNHNANHDVSVVKMLLMYDDRIDPIKESLVGHLQIRTVMDFYIPPRPHPRNDPVMIRQQMSIPKHPLHLYRKRSEAKYK